METEAALLADDARRCDDCGAVSIHVRRRIPIAGAPLLCPGCFTARRATKRGA